MDSQPMHVCRLCDKLLSSSSSLDRHMLTHSGERPFVCKRCQMTFTTNGNMHRHMRTHLHKDSLARQQQEQQLKSLVGASVSSASLAAAAAAAASSTATATINSSSNSTSPALNTTANTSKMVPIEPASSSSNNGSISLAAGQQQQHHHHHHQPQYSGRSGRNQTTDRASRIGASAQASSAASMNALINQQLVTAFNPQQQLSGRGKRAALHPCEVSTTTTTNNNTNSTSTISSTGSCQRGSAASPGISSSSAPSIIATNNQSSLSTLGPSISSFVSGIQATAKQMLRHPQLDPKTLMMGALQGDQLGLESVKAVMLAAAAAAAAAAVSHQQQQHHHHHHHQHHSQVEQQQQQQSYRQLIMANEEFRQQQELGWQGLQTDVDGVGLNELTAPQQRLRGKRRKQVNPRSTRVHRQTAASLNSDQSDDDMHLANQSRETFDSQSGSPKLHSDDMMSDDSVTRFQRNQSSSSSSPSSSLSLKGKHDEDTDDNYEDEDDGGHQVLGSTDKGMKGSVKEEQQSTGITCVSIKREMEDCNNNQCDEEENIDREGLRRGTKRPDIDADDGDEDMDDDMDGEYAEEGRTSGRLLDYKESEQSNRLNLPLLSYDKAGSASYVNTKLNDNNSCSQMSLTMPITSSHTTNTGINNELDLQHNQQQQQINFEQQQTLSNPLTTMNGEIIEDISQSYVKTANPNAARKGGKRNRHCYKCKLCTYSSVDRCTLVRHLRIHSGERPYICGICRYAFTTKANCERHVRKRHKKQYNSLGGAGGGGVKGSNGGGRSLIITDHSNHQTIPVKVNPVAAQTISQTLQRIQEKQQNPFDPFNQIDLAAQALDLSCKFQSSK